MRVLRLDITHFRGFSELSMRPRGHVVLVGPPRRGRSDIVEALRCVLSPDATRFPLSDDLDFFSRDTSQRAEVEVTLGDLGSALEQDFFDELELWDENLGSVLQDLSSPFDVDKVDRPWVLRLCYRAVWDQSREEAAHWVDFPKLSRPDEDQFERVGRRQRNLLFSVAPDEGRPLNFGARGLFRQIVANSAGDDFATATGELLDALQETGRTFTASTQVAAALESVLQPLRPVLNIEGVPSADVVTFTPEGASVASVLRSLNAALTLGSAGAAPVQRQGTAAETALRIAEALAALPSPDGIFVVDDLGENLDDAATQHLASVLRRSVRQVWVTTRRPAAMEAFRASELVRLSVDTVGRRKAHALNAPRSRQERALVRHAFSKLLPALGVSVVIIVEGRHDRETRTALASRLFAQEGEFPPSAFSVAIIDSGEGKNALGQVSLAGRQLGLRTVCILDHDRGDDSTIAELLPCADCVVRLPTGHAIERTLVAGLEESVLRQACNDIIADYSIQRAHFNATVSGSDLVREACELLKSSGGLHTQFLDALPEHVHPPGARQLLAAALSAARTGAQGDIQL